MKTKFYLTALTIVLLACSVTLAQDKAAAKSEKAVTWYGIDFTKAKFTLITEDPSLVISQYLKSINQLVQMEPEKFNIKKFFNKSEVDIELDQANEKNSKINSDGFVISDEHKISLDDVKEVIAGYNTKGKTGLGLIFVAENLHKVQQTGSYYVVFFNQDTKAIVDAQHVVSKPTGIGFRNYWAGTVYNTMKTWL